jgi:hypothetical protein
MGKSVPKAFHGLGKFHAQKIFFWVGVRPKSQKLGSLFWDRVWWETFFRPNLKFWDLGFGTDFLCRGGEAFIHVF